MNFLKNSTIKPLGRYQYKPVKIEKCSLKNTIYEIENVELPFEINMADQRQIFEIVEKMMMHQDVRIVGTSIRNIEIAHSIVNQLREQS